MDQRSEVSEVLLQAAAEWMMSSVKNGGPSKGQRRLVRSLVEADGSKPLIEFTGWEITGWEWDDIPGRLADMIQRINAKLKDQAWRLELRDQRCSIVPTS